MAHSSQQQPDHSTLIKEARRSALDMGTEDNNGFWELIWALRVMFPQVDDETLHSVSRDALGELFGEGLIRVVQWESNSEVDQVVPKSEAWRLINEMSSWAPPENTQSAHPRFIATPTGERVYYSGLTSAQN